MRHSFYDFLGDDLLEPFDQLWQVILNGEPYNFVIHGVVMMNHQIPHRFHLFPGQLRMILLGFYGKPADCLSDNFQSAYDGILA